jgi:hypothetical protein
VLNFLCRHVPLYHVALNHGRVAAPQMLRYAKAVLDCLFGSVIGNIRYLILTR